MKTLLRCVPGARALSRQLRKHYTGYEQPLPRDYPRGHYYSPSPDVAEIRRHGKHLFDRSVRQLPGIDIGLDQQARMLAEVLAAASPFDWPKQAAGSRRFHLDQNWFSGTDAIVLCGMLRRLRPAKVIEIGSGFSSALMLDVDELHLGGQTQFTFIEPHPARLLGLLHPQDRARCRIIDRPAQAVPLEEFAALAEGDMLFVDSSHVARIGSDVNYILFDVLPCLAEGVVIHFHDVCWPFEYPADWIENGVAWNEAYMLRAFMQYNSQFHIILFNDLARRALGDAGPDKYFPPDALGQSLWLGRGKRQFPEICEAL